ncbi:hypothetical protein [Actinomadura sp. 9N215]|uniref:hypothetical protein n=1 Tax=Actinomadura sp. 9N215 TaxID=3375150 RepID=UPI00379380F5
MLNLDDWGPVEQLVATIRRRAPQLAASIVPDEETGLRHVRVTYRHDGPLEARWHSACYHYRRGDGLWKALPADAEEAANALAEELGAGTSTTDEPPGTA